MDDLSVIGIDIGGSHITAGLIDPSNGQLDIGSLVRSRVDTSATVEKIIGLWGTVILQIIENCHQKSLKLGIAMPGPFDYEQGVSLIRDQGKFDALHGLNVKKLLADQVGLDISDIHLMNDADCFLKGEVYGGAARGYRRAIGVTLGTGLGTARYAEGIAEDAGLWSHPFKDGIAEDYLCTRWFVNRYREVSQRRVNDVKQLCDLYDSDPAIKELFLDFSANLADLLFFFIHEEAPDVVVLGGSYWIVTSKLIH